MDIGRWAAFINSLETPSQAVVTTEGGSPAQNRVLAVTTWVHVQGIYGKDDECGRLSLLFRAAA